MRTQNDLSNDTLSIVFGVGTDKVLSVEEIVVGRRHEGDVRTLVRTRRTRLVERPVLSFVGQPVAAINDPMFKHYDTQVYTDDVLEKVGKLCGVRGAPTRVFV